MKYLVATKSERNIFDREQLLFIYRRNRDFCELLKKGVDVITLQIIKNKRSYHVITFTKFTN